MMIVRQAQIADAESILAIYKDYVESTVITFEYEAPGIEDFCQRMEKIVEKYPYLVAESDEGILGFSYASAFRPRAAYDWSAETTIYIKRSSRQRGIGRLLYDKIEEICLKQHITNLYACIAYKQEEDSYLNHDSVSFHKQMGFVTVGIFQSCGQKFGRWYDMIWMEKIIADHSRTISSLRPFSDFTKEELEALGIYIEKS